MMRQVVLDTETTGLEFAEGHRVIEIGCIEMMNRKLTGKEFHTYINPERSIDAGASNITGIKQDFLKDKPLFKDIAHEFLTFIKDSELIIHNAPFDVGFINHELALTNPDLGKLSQYCQVFDTLMLARKIHPGQRNSLDALIKRYKITSWDRTLHGALLDAQILAQVYLAMTSGQSSFFDENDDEPKIDTVSVNKKQAISKKTQKNPSTIIKATQEELSAHEDFLKMIHTTTKKSSLWAQLSSQTTDHPKNVSNDES